MSAATIPEKLDHACDLLDEAAIRGGDAAILRRVRLHVLSWVSPRAGADPWRPTRPVLSAPQPEQPRWSAWGVPCRNDRGPKE